VTLPILYRDDRVVVVDKPPGLISHRQPGVDDDALLQRARDTVGAYVWLVHRLDRGASGAVILALDREAARILSDAFAANAVAKRYLAITRGHPPEHVTIDHPIPREPNGERVPAVTEIWRRETFGRYALVEAAPRTGRLHQIRRHLKSISCPLIGDVRYGKGLHNRIFREHHGLHRLALHATSIAFDHPSTNTRIVVESPLAADLDRAIASCRVLYTALS
jgi:tRNA pseudouridine65 synthase